MQGRRWTPGPWSSRPCCVCCKCSGGTQPDPASPRPRAPSTSPRAFYMLLACCLSSSTIRKGSGSWASLDGIPLPLHMCSTLQGSLTAGRTPLPRRCRHFTAHGTLRPPWPRLTHSGSPGGDAGAACRRETRTRRGAVASPRWPSCLALARESQVAPPVTATHCSPRRPVCPLFSPEDGCGLLLFLTGPGAQWPISEFRPEGRGRLC